LRKMNWIALESGVSFCKKTSSYYSSRIIADAASMNRRHDILI
jgi:hypothetical protein